MITPFHAFISRPFNLFHLFSVSNFVNSYEISFCEIIVLTIIDLITSADFYFFLIYLYVIDVVSVF